MWTLIQSWATSSLHLYDFTACKGTTCQNFFDRDEIPSKQIMPSKKSTQLWTVTSGNKSETIFLKCGMYTICTLYQCSTSKCTSHMLKLKVACGAFSGLQPVGRLYPCPQWVPLIHLQRHHAPHRHERPLLAKEGTIQGILLAHS